MTTATIQDKALLAAPKDPGAPASALTVEVARKHGVSPFAQLRQMIGLMRGPGRMAMAEYYAYGMFDPSLTMDQKREFVGAKGSWMINDRLNPGDLTRVRVFVADKVMYTALLRQLGLPTTDTQAVASTGRHFGNIPALHDPAMLRAFLTGGAHFPLFGKPCEGRASVGSALLTGIEAGQIVMGNGRRADLDAFCAEVFADYPDGYIFQTALTQHPDLATVIGDAIGTVRLVTIRDADTPRLLYAVWKIPSPEAMSDNFWQAGSMVAQVDNNGRVGRCHAGTGLEARQLETHPVSGKPFEGLTIPHWEQARDVACKAHGLFPEFGVIGWDMAITPDGPVIVEANDNTYHALWQLANGQGIRNGTFMQAFDNAAERSAAMFRGKVELFKQREREKGRRV